MPSEFDIIRQLAEGQKFFRDEIKLGIGDDAAVLEIPAGHELVVSTDTLNQGVHFTEDDNAEDIGYKALAVNLSDLAAMGAQPLAVNLSLSLPASDDAWLKSFASGLFSLASQYQVQLTGGDTTQGPLSISMTIMGLVPAGQALQRKGAKSGDSIYVTGTLGDAGAALLGKLGELKLNGPQQEALYARLTRPVPRIETGLLLRGVASSCIDISDGLAADLGHILEQSAVGATVYVDQIPLSSIYREVFDMAGGWSVPLSAGDDYELCFTVDDRQYPSLHAELAMLGVSIRCIGMIEQQPGLRLQMPDGAVDTRQYAGYEHFS